MTMNVNRFAELSGMAITNKEAEGIKLYMEKELEEWEKVEE